jgi:hypothetical protein
MSLQEHDHAQEDHRDALIHSLLVSLYEEDSQREARIKRLLAMHSPADRSMENEAVVQVHSGHTELRQKRRIRFTKSRALASMAAVILLIIGAWSAFAPTSAEAALARAAKILHLPITRVYDVEFVMQEGVRGPSGRFAKLYSQSSDRFLLDFEEAPVQPALIGGNSERRWIRFGRRTWQSDDPSDRDFPGAMLLDRMTIRQLHFNELLTELPEDYQLRWLDDAMLAGESQPCQRIEAIRKFFAPSTPTQVVVWLDPKTKLTRQIEVAMRPGSNSRIQRFVARYREDQPLDESFFLLESHQ